MTAHRVMKKTLCIGLFISLLLVFDMKLGDAPYAVLLATACALGVIYFLQFAEGVRTSVAFAFARPGLGTADCLISLILLWSWLPIVFSWFVGAMVGLINGVAPDFILRNFFGLLSFSLLPVLLLVGPSSRMLIETVIVAGLFQGAIALGVTIMSPPDVTLLFAASSISDLRSLYSVGFIAVFPVLTVGLAVRWLMKHRSPELCSRIVRLAGTRTVVLLAAVALIIPAMSKGFILATLVLIIAMLSVSLSYAVRFRMSWLPTVGALAVGVAIYMMLPEELLSLVGYSFGSEESGNTIRSEQYEYLKSEMTWLGNGLGASLRSGYSRDDTGYGFELTYVNLVHKLGIWSVFLLGTYLLSTLMALWRLWRRIYVLEAAFALGAMGYLIVGAANPLLLSPTAVSLQCVAIFLLIRPYLVYSHFRLYGARISRGLS